METKKSALFIIKERVPGLNGSDGLIREHFHAAGKRKKRYINLIMAQKTIGFKTPVNVIYTRYACRLMDWDNHCASFKHIGDALVACNIIPDDKPSVIINFIPMQVKVKKREQELIKIEIKEY